MRWLASLGVALALNLLHYMGTRRRVWEEHITDHKKNTRPKLDVLFSDTTTQRARTIEQSAEREKKKNILCTPCWSLACQT